MKKLTVFYDRDCGLCRAVRRWMLGQAAYVPMRFVALQSVEAREICPNLNRYKPESEIVVMGDGGEIYQGGKAWVMCLWALKEYRGMAMRMGSPMFLPLAKRVCHLISRNRLRLSKWFFKRSAKAVEREVACAEEESGDGCESGACTLNHGSE